MTTALRMTIKLGLAGLLAACTSTALEPPPTWDGLEYRAAHGIDALYVSPAGPTRGYRTVIVDDPVVTLDRNWRLNRETTATSSAMTAAEIEGLKQALSGAFKKILVAELAAGGYPSVPQAQPDTLRISSALANVYMNTPPGTMITWPMYAGRMTLVMDLRDAQTGQLLARILDEQVGDLGMLQLPNTVVNSPDFRRAVQGWSQAVLACLGGQSRPTSSATSSSTRGANPNPTCVSLTSTWRTFGDQLSMQARHATTPSRFE
jgi:hypothetical protein